MTQGNHSTAGRTEQEKQFLNLAQQMTGEELQFLLDMAQLMEKWEPDRRAAMRKFAESQADLYPIQTAAGRASFLEAMRAAY